MVLLRHQFRGKLQIYTVEVSNAFASLHEQKELFNDNANFVIGKGLQSSLLRIHRSQKGQIRFPNLYKNDNLYTKIMQHKI